MLRLPGFKFSLSYFHSFLVSDYHNQCLYCIGDAQVSTKCNICSSFSSRTWQVWDLPLRKHLMEQAMRPLSSLGWENPLCIVQKHPRACLFAPYCLTQEWRCTSWGLPFLTSHDSKTLISIRTDLPPYPPLRGRILPCSIRVEQVVMASFQGLSPLSLMVDQNVHDTKTALLPASTLSVN